MFKLGIKSAHYENILMFLVKIAILIAPFGIYQIYQIVNFVMNYFNL